MTTTSENPDKKPQDDGAPVKYQVLDHLNILLKTLAEIDTKIPTLLRQRAETITKLQLAKGVLDAALGAPSPLEIHQMKAVDTEPSPLSTTLDSPPQLKSVSGART